MDYSRSRRLSSFWSWGRYYLLLPLLSLALLSPAYADNSDVSLSVWTNEAIVSAYTFSATNLLQRQKDIAKYFTTQGWINFTKALETAKLKDAVQRNNYTVSAVALLPPSIKSLSPKEWQATMPLMVLYKNPHYQQKQTLTIVITFITTKPTQGVRGFAISSFNAVITSPPCPCESQHATNTIV
jgi:hypothetical protein